MALSSPERVCLRNPKLSWRVLAGEAVILHPADGTLHRLNDTGTRIWEHLDGKRSIADIGEALAGEFEIAPAEATVAVTELLGRLADAGLVAEGG